LNDGSHVIRIQALDLIAPNPGNKTQMIVGAALLLTMRRVTTDSAVAYRIRVGLALLAQSASKAVSNGSEIREEVSGRVGCNLS